MRSVQYNLIREPAVDHKNGVGKHTLLYEIELWFTDAFNVYLFGFTKLSTVFTLGYGASLLFYLVERAVCVFARRRPVAFDAGLAARR